MKYRLKIEPKIILEGILIPFLFIFLQSVPVQADTGDLKINNQVIYEKNEGSQSNSATFIIHELFMDDMSERDKQLNEEKTKLVTEAQKEVFLAETPEQLPVTQQVTPLLFSSGYALNDSLDSGESGTEQGNNIGTIFFCIVGGVFVMVVGILLGRAFPTWLKKDRKV